MMTPYKVVETAMSWLDTRYQHGVYLKGHGVDCAHLIGAVALELGVVDKLDIEPYTSDWAFTTHEEFALAQLAKYNVKPIPLQTGAIVCFKYGNVTSHMGIMVSPDTFIHANLQARKVCLNTIDSFLPILTHTFGFPGVTYHVIRN